MTLTITPTQLKGSVIPPPSKSQSHRLLIAAALAQGESVIHNVAHSKDIDATVACLTEMGAEFAWDGNTLTVYGVGANPMSPMARMALPRLDCGESGSTLRFLIPIALALRGGGIFTGHGRLMERPQGPYFDLFKEKGIFFEQKDGVLTVRGVLTPGEYRLPGDVSSQFFTGLLFALPLLGGPSVLIPTTQLESGDYVTMTLRAMAQFGVELPTTLSLPPQWHTPGNQTYRSAQAAVEADWSQAGFWYAAQFLGNPVELTGLNFQSGQGDCVIAAHFDRMCAQKAGSKVGRFLQIDVSNCPDLLPPLALMATFFGGSETVFCNAARLRMKESDRLRSVTQVLNALGAKVEEGPDSLAIHGVDKLDGGVRVDSFNDHRIAMMTAIAATRCESPVTLTGAEAVSKSYPGFWKEYQRLGGQVKEVTA